MSKGRIVLFVAGLVVLLLAAGGFNWFFLGNISEGLGGDGRVGVISKCSLKGRVFKTHECDAFVGAANVAGPTLGASIWSFTVRDSDWDAGLGATIQQALESGTPVKMEYIQPRWVASWRTDSGYYVIKVEPRKEVRGER